MSVSFTWLGHGTFVFHFDGHETLVDPFITDNPATDVDADSLNPEFIFITHAHGDHLADMASIAARTAPLWWPTSRLPTGRLRRA